MFLRFVALLFGFTITNFIGFSQGLPPGWDFIPTPINHIISIPLTCNPNINGVRLSPGDYIGVFYLNSQGNLTCGGAVVWTDTANTGLIAFGDDSFTPEKDGFSAGELLRYKVFSWMVEKEYSGVVTCNPALPSSCTNFTSNGLSGLASLSATGLFATVSASSDSICIGNSVQLSVNVSGGSGNYNFNWFSDPPGFNSNLQNPVVTPVISTEYFVTVTEGANTVTGNIGIVVITPPTVFAGNPVNVCENQNVQLEGTATNIGFVYWTTSGDGTFTDPDNLDPLYILGLNDLETGSVGLTLTAYPIAPCASSVSSSLTVNVLNLPMVYAGDDFTVCQNTLIQLEATASDYSSVLWTTSGDGSFSTPTILNPIYQPGNNDFISGLVQLTVMVSPVSPCLSTDSDFISIEIQPLPSVDPGSNAVVCENENVSLSGTAANFENVLWGTMGDGSFDNPTEFTTIYYPGEGDISSGTAIVTLTAFPVLPCSISTTEPLTINIAAIPDVFAGNDATICETGIHQVSGIANNYDEVIWTTAGDGSFDDPNLLSTTYSPGQSDINTGHVELLLTAYPEFPCSLIIGDEVILNITKQPAANAGSDVTICENSVIALAGGAINFNTIQWFTDGDGTFSDPLILEPTYFPGNNDVLTGVVNLKLTASPLTPCSIVTEDSMVLEIFKLPVVNAGEDATIKSDETIALNGFAQNYLTIEWSTNGDGTFTEINVLNPVYTPGSNDIENTIVNLTLTTEANLPCNGNFSDAITLTIDTITSVNSLGLRTKPIIYPNPNQGEFKLCNLAVFGEDFYIKIISLEGKLIINEYFTNFDYRILDEVSVDIKKFDNGIYLLKVFNNKHFFDQKVIVLRE